jgi:hypothetical protein
MELGHKVKTHNTTWLFGFFLIKCGNKRWSHNHSYDILGARMLWKPKEARILKNFIDQPV